MVNAADGPLPFEPHAARRLPRQPGGSCFSIDVNYLGRDSVEPTPRLGMAMSQGLSNPGLSPRGALASQGSDEGYVAQPQSQGVALGEWLAQRIGSDSPNSPYSPRAGLRTINVQRRAGTSESPRMPAAGGSTPMADSIRVVQDWQERLARDASGSLGPGRRASDVSDVDVFDEAGGLKRMSVVDQWSSDEEDAAHGRPNRGDTRGSGGGRGRSGRGARRLENDPRAAPPSPLARQQTRSGAANRLNFDSKVMERRHLKYDSKAVGEEGGRSRRAASRSNSGRSNAEGRPRSRTPPRSPHYRTSEAELFDSGASGPRGGEDGRRGEDLPASAPNFLMASRTSIYDTKDTIFGSMYDIVIPPSPLDVQESQCAAQEEVEEPMKSRFSCMPGKSMSRKQGKRSPLKWFVCGGARILSEPPAARSLDRSLTTVGSAELSQAANSRNRDLYKQRHAVLRTRMEAALSDQNKGKPTGIVRGISDDYTLRAGHPMQGQDLDTAFSGVIPGSPYAGSVRGTGRTVSIQRGQAGTMGRG
ncbi:unnamed protein product [Ostreobium quekettii]|uniref:Uncharacterized protein n=1 Tax=Ostreobium quekettii TaxID=121088 RepID=A0A8S1JG21_9CHLO|nr:unnamed protein product [Ostreobium quekettii]|eukprot:evm.model.scf_373.5 EVM.evm.TU.scf_373.5   scf_373:44709-46750(+)